jgi:hypothetical protein
MKIIDRNPILAISACAGIVTIAMTPWWNEDSLIVPKLVILFCVALYFVYDALSGIGKVKNSNISKITYSVAILMLIQILIVFIFTDAPREQQFYGKFGRGLGIATEISIIVILLVLSKHIMIDKLNNIFLSLILSALITSTYSITQYYGYDFFNWQTRTNGIIGTLGNPNFQSSFAAIALIPTLSYLNRNRKNIFFTLVSIIIFLYTIYICESTQGYVASLIALGTYLILILFYKSKFLFLSSTALGLTLLFLTVLGMVNKGPLSDILYKFSVKSRGEMLRNTFSMIQDNKFLGVGFDSLGDNYLRYKDFKTTLGVNEFTDHAHNLYVNYAAIAGIPYAILQFVLTLIVILSIVNLLRNQRKINHKLIALFSAWVCYQSQALISPSNISMLTWSAIFSGAIIGISSKSNPNLTLNTIGIKSVPFNLRVVKYSSLIIAFFLMWPYYNVDKRTQDALSIGNANLAISAANSFPRSSVRYERLGETLLKSGLQPQALEISEDLVAFNPKSTFGWGLIMINEAAATKLRREAKEKLIFLDPQNLTVQNYKLPD